MTDRYASLSAVLDRALDRASGGKGKRRHATDEPFEKQGMIRRNRQYGTAFGFGQIDKKLEEAHRFFEQLEIDRGINELLDVINYAAGIIIVADEYAGAEKLVADEPELELRPAAPGVFDEVAKAESKDEPRRYPPVSYHFKLTEAATQVAAWGPKAVNLKQILLDLSDLREDFQQYVGPGYDAFCYFVTEAFNEYCGRANGERFGNYIYPKYKEQPGWEKMVRDADAWLAHRISRGVIKDPFAALATR